jgi:pimeloyl-ACP methyl ester carboxylesterase
MLWYLHFDILDIPLQWFVGRWIFLVHGLWADASSWSKVIPILQDAVEGKPLLIFDKGGFAYINPALFHDFFVQDVDQAQAKVLAVVQKPANVSGLVNVKSGPPAWKQLPTWYEVSEYDHAIPPAVERMFAKHMNATTISLPSSHASLVSHPAEIAQLILNATKGITK